MVNPTLDLQRFRCVFSLPARSPEVEGQGHCKDDAHQHQERQPGLQKARTAGSDREHPQRGETQKNEGEEVTTWGKKEEQKANLMYVLPTTLSVLYNSLETLYLQQQWQQLSQAGMYWCHFLTLQPQLPPLRAEWRELWH